MQKLKEEKKNIKENIKWFKKFSLEKRLEIAHKGAMGIKILRNMVLKKHGKSD